MSVKRAADDATVNEKPNKAAKLDKPLKVYQVMSLTTTYHELHHEYKSYETTEYDVHGLYTCLATANNAARAMLPEDSDDDEDEVRLYESPSLDRHTPGEPLRARYMPAEDEEVEIWVASKIVDQTVEDEWSLSEEEDWAEDEEGGDENEGEGEEAHVAEKTAEK